MTSLARVLNTSTEIWSAICHLFRSSRNERVAIPAYVGDSAQAFLPSPKEIHLVCSPTHFQNLLDEASVWIEHCNA